MPALLPNMHSGIRALILMVSRHVRTQHVDKDEDDPQLRDALA
jgi:hypothetical protein